MLFLMFIFSFIFPFSINESVEVCKSVQQNGFFSKTSNMTLNGIAKFSFDMSVTFNANDSSFPNTLIVTNFTFSNFNTDNNFTFNNLTFTFFGNPHKMIDCSLILTTKNCAFKFSNGEIIYFLNYGYFESLKVAVGPKLYVNDGTFFDGKTSELLNPNTNNLTCNNYETTNNTLYFWKNYCCNSFEEIQITNSNNEKCQNFETIASVSDPSTKKPINIKSNYFVLSNNSLLINVSLLNSPDPFYIYYVYVGYPFVSYINGSSVTKNTSFTLNLENEKQYEILFDYNPSATDSGNGIFKYGGINLGEIIFRNEIFLKFLL